MKAAGKAEGHGKEATMQCPRCSLTIPDDSVFCPECGRKVAVPEPVPVGAGRAADAGQKAHAEGHKTGAAPAEASARVRDTRRSSSAGVATSTRRGTRWLWLVFIPVTVFAVVVVWLLVISQSEPAFEPEPPPATPTDAPIDPDPPPDGLVVDIETAGTESAYFEAEAGDLIVLQAMAIDPHADPVVSLFSPTGASWVNDDGFTECCDSYLEVTADASGTYEALVSPYAESEPGLVYFVVEIVR